MRTMYDSVNAAAIPTNAVVVAGYVNPSGYAWSDAAWARFPSAVKVRITPQVSHTGVGIHVLDVENGDATPAQAPTWVHAQRALGQDPTVYCSAGIWSTVQAAFQAAGVAQPHYWVAAYPGTGQNLPTLNGIQAVAHQYADRGPYDLSVVADYWPGVDNLMAVLQPDDYTNIAVAVWAAVLNKGTTSAPADTWLVNADTNSSSETVAALTPVVAAVQAAVAAQGTPTLPAEWLTAIEGTVSTAVAGLNLSVSATDQAAIAAAVAALLGAKLSA